MPLIGAGAGSANISGITDPSSVVLAPDLNANRPAAGTAGRLFLPTDWCQIYRDNGASWDGFLPGKGACKVWTPSGFGTTLNGSQTGYSATTVNGGVKLKLGANASLKLSGQFKNVPAQTNYGLQMLVDMAAGFSKNYYGVGLAITDGTKYVVTALMFLTVPSIVRGYRWSDDHTTGSALQTDNIAEQRAWLRMFVDNVAGGTLHYGWSMDGVEWQETTTETLYNNVIGATATQYGYVIFSSTNQVVQGNIHSLQEVTS